MNKIKCHVGGNEGPRCIRVSSKVTEADKNRLDELRKEIVVTTHSGKLKSLSLADILHYISKMPAEDLLVLIEAYSTPMDAV